MIEEKEKLNIDLVGELLKAHSITAVRFYDNSKASEYYIKVVYHYTDEPDWEAVIPYIYRRTNLHLKTEKEIADYVVSLKSYFRKTNRKEWRKKEEKIWNDIANSKKDASQLVTINFFRALLSFKEENKSMPENPNPQRRFQDIKDMGYTIAIYPIGGRQFGKMLLPIPKHTEMGYEVFTPQFKARVIRLLGGVNAYEAKVTPIRSLIPDHKFSEVRWDDATKVGNPMTMTDQELIDKFQLLDNQRNQQKREVCRKCFQDGIRGTIYGIKYFYQGTEKWDKSIPKIGKASEKGCIGCPWYDIEKWRRNLNNVLGQK